MATDLGVIVKWNEAAYREFCRSPNGEVGRHLMHALGSAVLADARRRSLRRTGQMAAEMTYHVGSDEGGLYCEVSSPVRSAKGYPYANVHEGPRVRDRRPHRALVPALDAMRTVT